MMTMNNLNDLDLLDAFLAIRAGNDKDIIKCVKKVLKQFKIKQDDLISYLATLVVTGSLVDEKTGAIKINIQDLKRELTKSLNDLVEKQNTIIEGQLKQSYEDTYAATCDALGMFVEDTKLGITPDWKLVRPETVQAAVNNPIDGKLFSTRVWDNTDKLANRIYNDVVSAVAQGKSVEKIARQIKKDFGVSSYEAQRLINTEVARVVSEASLETYKNSGVVKQVMWCATLELNTCDYCADLDGKYFDFNNCPIIPAHPNCRCTYVPVIEGYNPTTRTDNETKQNISYQSFKDWKKNKK